MTAAHASVRLANLAHRHGSTTPQQRRRLRHSAVRHVNAGNVDLTEANAFLYPLGIDPVAGPGEVSFRVPVAMTVVHEDTDTDSDIDSFQYRLEETGSGMWRTRLDGYPTGFRVGRPGRVDPDTGRRYARVSADLRLTVTVATYADEAALVAVATALLRRDLDVLRDEVVLLDEPTVWDITPPPADDSADPDSADDGGSDNGGWAYRADELDEGNYIDYVPDSDPDDGGFDPTAPAAPPPAGLRRLPHPARRLLAEPHHRGTVRAGCDSHAV